VEQTNGQPAPQGSPGAGRSSIVIDLNTDEHR
jgi:hypothetical protein